MDLQATSQHRLGKGLVPDLCVSFSLSLARLKTQLLIYLLTGHLVDVPKDLKQEIANLERLFTVDQAKLKEITTHFVSELEKGLSVEGGSIVSNDLKSGVFLSFNDAKLTPYTAHEPHVGHVLPRWL